MKFRVVNPNELDIAGSQKVWWQRFFRGHNHIAYAALIVSGIGLYEVVVGGLVERVIGAVLLLLGGTIFVDEYSHLFTN